MSVNGAPIIKCQEATHICNTLESEQTISRPFTILNQGDELLEIRRVRACCGAWVEIESKQIYPGSNTDIRVSLSLRGRRGQAIKTVYLESNDPVMPWLSLKMVVSILPTNGPFMSDVLPLIEPSEIVTSLPHVITILMARDESASVTRYVEIKTKDKRPFNLVSVVVPVPSMTVVVDKIGQSSYRLKISSIPLRAELDGDVVTVQTDLVDFPILHIPFRVVKNGFDVK